MADSVARWCLLFNRVQVPDIDPSRMAMLDRVSLSEPDDARIPLLWIALLAGRIDASLAASGGVSDVHGVVKYLLASTVVMTTSALLRHEAAFMAVLVDGLRRWLEARDFASPQEMRELLSWRQAPDRDAYTRASLSDPRKRGGAMTRAFASASVRCGRGSSMRRATVGARAADEDRRAERLRSTYDRISRHALNGLNSENGPKFRTQYDPN